MLVLSRKRLQSLWIGEKVRITVVKMGRGYVRMAIEAPSGVAILREELLKAAPSTRGLELFRTSRNHSVRRVVPV